MYIYTQISLLYIHCIVLYLVLVNLRNGNTVEPNMYGIEVHVNVLISEVFSYQWLCIALIGMAKAE